MDAAAGYQAVFLTDEDDLTDVGDDPCFKPPFPTWGICRPNVRVRLRPGQRLLFVAYHRPTDSYFARGLFTVLESITHLGAVRRFAGRPNVLLSAAHPGPSPAWAGLWRHKDLRRPVPPDFLATTVDPSGREWWHGAHDSHEIDNWKCRRIFRCYRPRLDRCLRAGACEKEGLIDAAAFANYIVGDPALSFLAREKTPYEAIAGSCGLVPKPPQQAHRHPELTLNRVQVDRLCEWFSEKGNPISDVQSDPRATTKRGRCQ